MMEPALDGEQLDNKATSIHTTGKDDTNANSGVLYGQGL